MDSHPPEYELLLRYVDGRIAAQERGRLQEMLRMDAAARAFMREVAEQAVMVADIERTALGRQAELNGCDARAQRPLIPVNWRGGLAVAAGLCLLAVAALKFHAKSNPGVIRVAKVTGSSQFFGARGKVQNTLAGGAVLRAGDTLETRSCDAWIELELRDGAKMTVAGQSTLRVLDDEAGKASFKLTGGSLWLSPGAGKRAKPLIIQTPTIVMQTRSAQFDVQTSPSETIARINEGSAQVKQILDGSEVKVAAGQQVFASLNRKEPLIAQPQPKPVNHWASDLGRVPEVILGRWLPPTAAERARLGAEPLLWPIPNRDPVMLYAAALSVLRGSDRPVLLQSGAKLVFRGRTERPQRVRFGFSTQKMHGVFAGKFEMDVSAGSLGRAGETWEIVLPLADFRPLQPQLSLSPEGLELNDVYALTIAEDAGLEINHVELRPGTGGG